MVHRQPEGQATVQGGAMTDEEIKGWMFKDTITGELASKSNSRMLVTIRGRPAFIKSKKARAYEKSFIEQSHNVGTVPYTGKVRLTAVIYYATQRPDLDDTLLCDCIERAGIIKNDRQIREKHLYHRIDRKNPRVEYLLSNIDVEHVLVNLYNHIHGGEHDTGNGSGDSGSDGSAGKDTEADSSG